MLSSAQDSAVLPVLWVHPHMLLVCCIAACMLACTGQTISDCTAGRKVIVRIVRKGTLVNHWKEKV